MQDAQVRTAKREERKLRALGIRERRIDKEAQSKHRRQKKTEQRRGALFLGLFVVSL
jgi:hypothetical protein